MNNSKDIEKYGDGDKAGVPEEKYPKREKKCFFGLLSLRSGLLITCAATVIMDVVHISWLRHLSSKDTTTESIKPFITDFNVTIPFIGGPQIALCAAYSYFVAPVGLYAAYNRSSRVMKYYKRMLYTEVIYGGFICYTNFSVGFYRDFWSVRNQATSPNYKLVGSFVVSFSLFMIATDRYRLYLANGYHRLLKEKETRE